MSLLATRQLSGAFVQRNVELAQAIESYVSIKGSAKTFGKLNVSDNRQSAVEGDRLR